MMNKESGIIYDDNTKLANAMKNAIQMNDETYKNMQIALEKISKEIYTNSLNNLREIVKVSNQ